jgi:mannose-1-phosphate guanylyltransferase / phosphomannomutase
MKAFILSAGAGTRLRPLTFNIPKPMVPIVNKPALLHTLENLRKFDIREVVINLHRYPNMIRKYFGDGRQFGMNITYSYEPQLLGTAGAVKKMEKYFTDTFLVLSGDGITDINLNKVLDFHKEKKSFATMVLKRVDVKFDYGVTILDKNARISQFFEKPSWSSVFANTVNTGIYVFEPDIFSYIPKNKFFDFGHQVWPKLLERKKKIFGYETEAFWCDVGNLKEYRHAQRSALDKRVKVIIPGEEIKSGIWVGKGTVIEAGAKLRSPCVIGKNCRIGKKCVVGKYTTIGDRSVIGPGAAVTDCVIWNGVKVNKNVNLQNCVISRGARISESISVFEGAVITVKKKGVI